ncbi:thioester domain-containing protein [Nocardiopsis sp. N85]|uniref:thioester domain-containing protein n=1 Tax=Nocardiopsis sp. N85 TaxID=3029400 RepID=UPI00237FB285|nr:thioester domain-containing protein [Nocardiopsis sp. N85]MDE3721666.1 thioester domain-containing protein [Nocardiopsis sp. N85]
MTQISLPRTAGRAGLAATAAAFLAFGMAAPAAAEPAPYEGAVTGTYIGNAENGPQVHLDGGNAPTSLFKLELEDGTVLTTYCIDFRTSIVSKAKYVEDKWDNYPGKGDFAEPAKVHWILQNSYPNVSAEELGAAAGVEGLSKADALGGTQAAIWHFSNGMDLKNSGNSAGVKKVYEYLVGNAQDLPQTSEPDATLSITPGTAEGEAGSKVGAFVIETSAASVPVVLDAPEGVTLVDLETGEPVTAVENGDKVAFDVPADAAAGNASFSLETTAEVATGRLFKGEDPNKPTQTLITAKGGETKVSASASASWTAKPEVPPTDEPSEPTEEPSEPTEEPSAPESPAPSESPSVPESPKPTPPADDRPSLPVTGGALAGLVAAGIAALGAGGGAIYLSRKRKAASTQE